MRLSGLVLALALAVGTGCGGDDDGPAEQPDTTIAGDPGGNDAADDVPAAPDIADTSVPDTPSPDAGPPDVPVYPDSGPDVPGSSVPVIPWNEGPYGDGVRDVAGDFTVQVLGGSFTLSESWSGEDSYLFIMSYAGEPSGIPLQTWQSSVADLLDRCPANVQILFGSYDSTFHFDVQAMEERVDATLAGMPAEAQAQWAGRIHYIDRRATQLSGALGGHLVEAGGPLYFAIDRFQRWRQVGSLYDWKEDSFPMEYVAHEAIWFNYEVELHASMDALAATEVSLWAGERHPGGWGGGHSSYWDVSFPDAAGMAAFDSMGIHLYTACPEHLQGKGAGCNEWDYIQQLFVCDLPIPPDQPPPDSCTAGEVLACECTTPLGEVVAAERACDDTGQYGDCACGCGTELARWVTPYGREGEWFTDLSPLMPLVGAGGTQRLRFAGANGYDLWGKMLLWDSGSGRRPVSLRYLWGKPGGTAFNESYNEQHPEVTFDLPEGATGAAIAAVISGHGHSSTAENCAEFCNHHHEFDVNGQLFTESHPVAGTWYGCRDQIGDGGVPNQFGTWIFGRGGWCAGMDITLWVQDVSDATTASDNVIGYRGLFQGQDYQPTITDPGGYLPEIKMTSWLVFYAPM